MHLGEGLLPAAHAVGWAGVAAPAFIVGLRRLEGVARVRAGLAAALTFAVTLFPIPIPVVGITSHMCATPLLGLLYGPAEVVVPTALVLLLQALLFAHGGLTTLGANLVTLGIVGPWAGFLVFRVLRRAGLGAVSAAALACFAGDLAVYLTDAGMLGWALAGSESSAVWGRRLVLALAPAQLPLAVLEGGLSGWMIRALMHSGRWRPAGGDTRGARTAVLALAALLSLASGACRRHYRGLDDAVFATAAASAGRPSRGSFDWADGEVGRALYGGAMLIAGLVLGRAWGRSARRRDEGDQR
jgi:cobalt/nickel transport system permease protein